MGIIWKRVGWVALLVTMLPGMLNPIFAQTEEPLWDDKSLESFFPDSKWFKDHFRECRSAEQCAQFAQYEDAFLALKGDKLSERERINHKILIAFYYVDAMKFDSIATKNYFNAQGKGEWERFNKMVRSQEMRSALATFMRHQILNAKVLLDRALDSCRGLVNQYADSLILKIDSVADSSEQQRGGRKKK